MRFQYTVILTALIAVTPPARAFGDPTAIEAAQKLTRDACEAVTRKDFKPLQKLIQDSDIRGRVLLHVQKSYRVEEAEQEKIAGGFIEGLLASIPQTWAYAAGATCFFPSVQQEKDAPAVPVRLDCVNAEGNRMSMYYVFRYRTSPEGPRLTDIETPLTGAGIVAGVISGMPESWPPGTSYQQALRRKHIAMVAQIRQQYEEAEGVSRAALKDLPKDLLLRATLVNALIAQKKDDEAKDICADLLANGEAPLFARIHLGAIAVRAKKYDEGIAHLQAVVAGLGEDDAFLAQLADAQLLAGRSAEGKATLERALKANPYSALGLEKRARLFVRDGDFDAAAGCLGKIKERYGLNTAFLRKDEDFSKLAKIEKYSSLFEEKKAP